MKKIFAIALALVMVLSMASAFALNNCSTNFAWPCDAKVNFCGRGTVEVVPFVKVNNGCGGFDWQANTCAAVVAGDEVHYAIKLNVEANPDKAGNGDKVQEAYWWDTAELIVKYTDKVTTNYLTTGGVKFDGYDMSNYNNSIDWDADKDKSYYLTKAASWIDVTDDDLDLKDVVFSQRVSDRAKAADVKVCAELTAEHSGKTPNRAWYYGDYEVKVDTNRINVRNTKTNGTFTYSSNGNTEQVTASSPEFQAEVNKMFNLNGCTLGTCLTDKNIQANFGWKDIDGKLKKCFNWSANATAVVNPECKVEIPKTGDASVVAYAVMALVAAAGAMGLKK